MVTRNFVLHRKAWTCRQGERAALSFFDFEACGTYRWIGRAAM
jgi:hypothetical protein